MTCRSRTEITAMILNTSIKETTKIKIMYNAFISYNQLKEYLSILIENNLMEYIEGARTYKTTEKGLIFLKMHRELAELLQTSTIKNDD